MLGQLPRAQMRFPRLYWSGSESHLRQPGAGDR